MPETLPSPAVRVVDPDGKAEKTWYQRLSSLWKAFNALSATVTTAVADIADAITRIGDLEADSVSGSLGTYTALSGTATTITGISTTAKMVVLNIVGMSWDNTAQVRIRIGPSGGVATSGYLGAGGNFINAGAIAVVNGTAGFDGINVASSAVYHGNVVFALADAATNTWTCSGWLARSDTTVMHSIAGSVPLSGVLERISITTVAGTAAADAGSVSISVYSHP